MIVTDKAPGLQFLKDRFIRSLVAKESNLPQFLDILDCQENLCCFSKRIEDASSVEQHDSSAQAFKIVFDLEGFDAGTHGKNLLQQLSQSQYIPLMVSQVVDECSDRLGWFDPKFAIERTVGTFDSQVTVEHK